MCRMSANELAASAHAWCYWPDATAWFAVIDGTGHVADPIATVKRDRSGSWVWTAEVDLRRPEATGDEPTREHAVEAATVALMQPVTLDWSVPHERAGT